MDGWTIEENGKYRTEDGRLLSLEEAIQEAIREGEFAEDFQKMHEEIYRQSMGEKVS